MCGGHTRQPRPSTVIPNLMAACTSVCARALACAYASVSDYGIPPAAEVGHSMPQQFIWIPERGGFEVCCSTGF